MARVIVSGDTKVIDKKGNTRFFSDTLINNAQFMKDGGWEIFDSPDAPDAPTFEMNGEQSLKAKTDAELAENAKAESDAKLAAEMKAKEDAEAKAIADKKAEDEEAARVKAEAEKAQGKQGNDAGDNKSETNLADGGSKVKNKK